MSRAIPLPQLGNWLAGELADAGEETAVLSGHFGIFSAGSTASDLLDGDAMPVPGAREMLDFTRLTWRATCEAAAANETRPFRLVALVDDIQFIRPVLNDRSLSERLAAELAADYLRRVPTLPAYHQRALNDASISNSRVLRHSESQWLFSERELRISAVRHLRQRFADGFPARAAVTTGDDGGTMMVKVPEQGEYCLIHSGRTSCAGGYLELLSALHARGVRRLVALVPMRCLGQIALGTALGRRLLSLQGFSVTNIAVPDPAVGLPAQVVPESADAL